MTSAPCARTFLGLVAGVTIAILAGASPSGTQRDQPAVNPDARAQQELQKRLQAYMEVREGAANRLSTEPPNPRVSQSELLARYIAQARYRAEQGDVLTSETRSFLRRQIARVLTGPDAAGIRASIMDENPGPIPIRINGRYPDAAPLTSMPPQLLAALPKLPAELEYRFLGRRLILLDADANLIVDYMNSALPR